MPKVILEFNLPEETSEYEHHYNGPKYSSLLWDFDMEFLRANIKHGIQEHLVDKLVHRLSEHPEYSREAIANIAETVLEVVREQLYSDMSDSGISIE